uniref:PA domain-containing protein n=1 Tax=Sarcophilus harrisii TaxID=9305 RepID=G3W4B6_SARHA
MVGGHRKEPWALGQFSLALVTLLHWSLWLTCEARANPERPSSLIKVTVQEPGRGPHAFLIHEVRYSIHSPKVKVTGLVLAPQPLGESLNLQGCDPETHFQVTPDLKQWIALLQRGNCTFKQKIYHSAVFHNAIAVVIYNNNEEPIPCLEHNPGLVLPLEKSYLFSKPSPDGLIFLETSLIISLIESYPALS